MGSISALLVVSFEFFDPFGLGYVTYAVLIVPFLFFISYKVIVKYNKLFNKTLAIITFGTGFMLDILLIYFLPENYLFIAG